MFNLHAFFPTLCLSRDSHDSSDSRNNAIIEKYIAAAFACLKEQLISSRVAFPRDDLHQETMGMFGKVLAEFDKMVITITKAETGQVSTFAYDSDTEHLHVRTFSSKDAAWTFHCGRDMADITVETRKGF